MSDFLQAAATGLASAVQGIFNYKAQKSANAANIAINDATNKTNLDIARETNALNKMLTEQSWARDDNAIQRRVADLKAAGLSPVLAAGAAAGNSAPIKAQGATMQSTRVNAPYLSAFTDALNAFGQTISTLTDIQGLKNNATIMDNMQSITDMNRVKAMLMSKELDNYDMTYFLEKEYMEHRNSLMKFKDSAKLVNEVIDDFSKVMGAVSPFFKFPKIVSYNDYRRFND